MESLLFSCLRSERNINMCKYGGRIVFRHRQRSGRGGGGAHLAGGERQRISIARAMLKDAPIVILDKATASVDLENEHLIQGALSELPREKRSLRLPTNLQPLKTQIIF